jgi:transcriptional regulator with XRE-family HTH domain
MHKYEESREIVENYKAEMKRTKLRQSNLARSLGWSSSYISQLMNCQRALSLKNKAMLDKLIYPPTWLEGPVCEKYKAMNHHHELTDDHEIVDFGDGAFVANKDGITLLKALNELGLRTRTHHIEKGEHSFVSIILDNVSVEIREVFEKDASREKFNGKHELLLQFEASN